MTSPTPSTTGNTLGREIAKEIHSYTISGETDLTASVNKVIDAVIRTLPKRVDMARLDGIYQYPEGYNSAITEVTSLLEEAKIK